MLVELSVSNIVIVTTAVLRPGPGLTVISGETGAGKSLLLDALDLLLGARSAGDLVGPEGDEAVVVGVFVVAEDLRRDLADVTGLDLVDDTLVIRRRIRRQGRSQAWINEQPVSAAGLRTCGERLVTLRLQNEQLTLAEPTRQLMVLDRFGEHAALADAYAEAHQACLDRALELERIEEGERDSVKELAHLRFQRDEILALDPVPGELEEIERRQELLAGAQAWQQLAAEGVALLLEDETALRPAVAALRRRLIDAPQDDLRAAAEGLLQAGEYLEEAGRSCARAADVIHYDAGELAEVERRLAAWHDLLRTYGGTEASLLAARDSILARLDELERVDERRDVCAAALSAAQKRRDSEGRKLVRSRRRAAETLFTAVHAELGALGMPHARLELHEDPDAGPTALGPIGQEFWLRTNPGIPSGPLGAVASGGEASRLGLALAVVLAGVDQVGTMVFDEVDAGVGGRLGGAIGDRLRRLATGDAGPGRTVIAITHSPQVAARATGHYLIDKRQTSSRTQVSVRRVEDAERQQELAEMLGGGSAALIQAGAMLTEGQQ